MTGPTTAQRTAVYVRAGARCEICNRDLTYAPPFGGFSVHHRIPRGRGGTNNLSNLMLLCGSGTTGCHGMVESRRTIAHTNGWLIATGFTPAEIPVRLHHGVVYLTDDGDYQVGAPMTRPPDPVDPFQVRLADVAVVVRKVQAHIPRIEDTVVDGRPAPAYIDAGTLQAMGDQVRADRYARRVAQAAGLATGTGTASRAPGNLSGIAVAAEYTFTLRHQIRAVHRHYRRTGLPDPLYWLPADEQPAARRLQTRALADAAPATALAGYLYELVWTINHTGLLASLEADVTWLARLGRTHLEGENRNTLSAPCPHCGRRTLVVYKDSGVIRCERPRDHDGTRPPCTCLTSDCACHTDPAYVHQWFRETRPNADDSWQALMRVLDHTKEIS